MTSYGPPKRVIKGPSHSIWPDSISVNKNGPHYIYDGEFTEDSVVDRVINMFIKRSHEGMIKYGISMEANPAAKLEWINHAQQEAMDFILYLERLKKEV